jgi:hypothetical protein
MYALNGLHISVYILPTLLKTVICSLLSPRRLLSYLFPSYTVLGLDNAGKTTILKKLSDEDIDTIMPTQGA